jgi:hypothetical protein
MKSFIAALSTIAAASALQVGSEARLGMAMAGRGSLQISSDFDRLALASL